MAAFLSPLWMRVATQGSSRPPPPSPKMPRENSLPQLPGELQLAMKREKRKRNSNHGWFTYGTEVDLTLVATPAVIATAARVRFIRARRRTGGISPSCTAGEQLLFLSLRGPNFGKKRERIDGAQNILPRSIDSTANQNPGTCPRTRPAQASATATSGRTASSSSPPTPPPPSSCP